MVSESLLGIRIPRDRLDAWKLAIRITSGGTLW